MSAVITRSALATINHLLSSARWARERLAGHAGRHALVRAEPFELPFAVAPDGFLAAASPDAVPTVTLTLPLAAVPTLFAGGPDRLMSAARIEGNAEFADALGFVFRHLRWDAEEDLSRLIGDILARRAVLGAGAVRNGATRALAALSGNVAEFLTEERPLLVPHAALAAQAEALTRLRDDLSRLEKRIERLTGAKTVRGGAFPSSSH